MNNVNRDRRNFIKNSLLGAASLSASSLFMGCSSFDDYLFEDRYDFKDEVMIVGAGISGLYLAQQLRSNKTEFRLFEGSSSLGGRIRSYEGSDYGASVLSDKDTLATRLVNDLVLQKKYLDKENYYLAEGMQSLTKGLAERIVGLIPYRNFRLRWKLIEISKQSSGFELVFENPDGQKKFICKKVALAIPPSQWTNIKGLLDLPEMAWAQDWLTSLKIQNTIKLILPASALAGGAKVMGSSSIDNLNVRYLLKKQKANPSLEVDIQYLLTEAISIDYVYSVLKRKMPFNYSLQNLNTEQYFDWQQVKLIKGSGFQNFMAVPESKNYNFQIVGDFTAVKNVYSVEGALESAEKAVKFFL